MMLCGGPAFAYTADNRTIDYVGVLNWSTNNLGGFVVFVEGLPTAGQGGAPNPCTFGVLYFDHASNFGKPWYNTLLAAKVSGLKVLVDYSQDGTNTCIVGSVRIKG